MGAAREALNRANLGSYEVAPSTTWNLQRRQCETYDQASQNTVYVHERVVAS